MRLYLMRHGEVMSDVVDPARPLSAKGRREVAAVAAFLGQAGVRVQRVFHSGKTRARETAELLAQAILADGSPEALSGLHPNDPVEPFSAELAGWNADTAVVGHLPFLGLLAGALTAAPGPVPVAFSAGAVVCLEKTGVGRFQLVWMVAPELLREGERTGSGV